MLPADITTVQWSPELAHELAVEERIALTDRHWKAISCWRELAARSGRMPALLDLDACCGLTMSELNRLFPGAAVAVLSRIAGVPE